MADEKENTHPTCLGIPTQPIQVEDPNKPLFGFGNQSTNLGQTDINNPAISQALNSLEIVLKKTVFEKSDFETLQSTRQLLPNDSEIYRLRPNISMSLLDNLSKKSDEYSRTQKLESSSEATTKQQQEAQQIQQQALEEHSRNARQTMDELEKRKDLATKQIDYFDNRQSPTPNQANSITRDANHQQIIPQ
jgi:hypothetical protein